MTLKPLHERLQENHQTGLPRSTEAMPLTRIEPRSRRFRLGLMELWDYRDLLYFLAWRDVKLRYKQTIIGAAWAIVQPLMTMFLFTAFLGRLIKIPTDGVPYPSMVNDHSLVTQIYIPRLILPLAAVLGGIADFAIAFVVLLPMVFYYGVMPTWAILSLPLFALLVVATAFAVALWLAPLNALYRDVGNAMPFLIQLWLFATPIAYPSNIIPKPWRTLYALNPMVGAIEGFRWAVVGGKSPAPVVLMIVSFCVIGLMLFAGLYYFQRREENLADLV